MGLYDPASGRRLLLAGANDGTERYIIGYLNIRAGSLVAYFPPAVPASDPRLNAANSVVDFGAIQTDGMVAVTKENSTWMLRPYPRWRNFTVLLSNTKFPEPASVHACDDLSGTVTPINQGGYWQLPLNGAKSYCSDAK
jgi:hypothetical protein